MRIKQYGPKFDKDPPSKTSTIRYERPWNSRLNRHLDFVEKKYANQEQTNYQGCQYLCRNPRKLSTTERQPDDRKCCANDYYQVSADNGY